MIWLFVEMAASNGASDPEVIPADRLGYWQEFKRVEILDTFEGDYYEAWAWYIGKITGEVVTPQFCRDELEPRRACLRQSTGVGTIPAHAC